MYWLHPQWFSFLFLFWFIFCCIANLKAHSCLYWTILNHQIYKSDLQIFMVRLFYWSNLPTLFVVKKNSCTKKVQLKCLTMKSAGIFDLQKCLMLKSTRKKDQYIWRLKLFSTDMNKPLVSLLLSSREATGQ